jgi:hypothetical protein
MMISLSETCAAATAHKLSSVKLKERCEKLFSSFPLLSSSRSSQETQTRSHELLEEIHEFVKKFVKPKISTPATREDNKIMISWFEKVLNDLLPDLRSFQCFVERIDQLESDLGLFSPLLNPTVGRFGSLSIDCEEIGRDLESLSQEISSFRDNGINDVRVFQLQTRCSNLLFLCRDTNDQISQLQNKLVGFVSLLSNDGNEEIGSQLPQIRRTIEDLLMNSKEIIPQQLVLIDSLNDSLVQSISECRQSMLQTFSLEFCSSEARPIWKASSGN